MQQRTPHRSTQEEELGKEERYPAKEQGQREGQNGATGGSFPSDPTIPCSTKAFQACWCSPLAWHSKSLDGGCGPCPSLTLPPPQQR